MKEKLKPLGGAVKSGAGKILKFFSRHKIIAAALIIALLIGGVIGFGALSDRKGAQNGTAITAELRDIEEKISDSTVVEPNSEYSVTANVSGEILDDFFEEGDYLNKDDVMYVIDSEAIENNIASADIAITRAKRAYDDAIKEDTMTVRDKQTGASTLESAKIAVQKAQQAYDDALRAASDLSAVSEYSGYVTEMHVSVGDTVAAGSPICDIADSTALKIDVPFNSADIANIYVGAPAELTLTKNGSRLNGTVTEISGRSVGGSGYTMYNYVTIKVQNPGAVSSGDTATAVIGNIACGDAGTFENLTEETISAQVSGKIEQLYISENSYIRRGDVILKFDGDSVNSQVNTALLNLSDAREALSRAEIQNTNNDANTALSDNKLDSAVENARLQYNDALLSKDNLLRQLDDYTVRAPISGTVVTKNKKKGDNASGMSASASSYSAASSGSAASGMGAAGSAAGGGISLGGDSSAMAVIYDMSRLKCTLNVDELDIKNIHVGQKVTVTTDVTDKEYTGVVDTVGIGGTAGQNGVTTFPVKIEIIDFDDSLLPGMNIDATIVLSSVHNALAIPVSCLNRGNTVYIKGEKTEENDAAPEGYHTVSVTTGAADDEYIQILSGLSEGDELYSEDYNVMDDMMDAMQEGHDAAAENVTGGGL